MNESEFRGKNAEVMKGCYWNFVLQVSILFVYCFLKLIYYNI